MRLCRPMRGSSPRVSKGVILIEDDRLTPSLTVGLTAPAMQPRLDDSGRQLMVHSWRTSE